MAAEKNTLFTDTPSLGRARFGLELPGLKHPVIEEIASMFVNVVDTLVVYTVCLSPLNYKYPGSLGCS